ncbi:MAG: hypothetical protein WCP89_01495, partial [archaeon]
YIKLNSILNGKADLTIQTIHEPISQVISNEIKNEMNRTKMETETALVSAKDMRVIIYSVVLLLFIILSIYFIRKLLGAPRVNVKDKKPRRI